MPSIQVCFSRWCLSGRSELASKSTVALFEATVLPHLATAHNFARWLLHDESNAEDVVRESYLRALKYFPGCHDTDSRAWLLTIMRNTTTTGYGKTVRAS